MKKLNIWQRGALNVNDDQLVKKKLKSCFFDQSQTRNSAADLRKTLRLTCDLML